MQDHGHSQKEVERRIGAPPGRGYLRDVVYGAIDGAVTTFAIVSGVAGAGLAPKIIIILGLANVLADGFSMAAGNYAGTKAELDDLKRIREIEERHIRDFPEGETRELREILRQKGLGGRLLEEATRSITRNRKAWIAVMLTDEYGMAPVDPHPMNAALATFAAFLVAGLIPLAPFLLGVSNAFQVSAGVTMAVFAAIGAAKGHWSLAPWWRSSLETLLIGGAAAALAFAVGRLFAI